MQVNIDPLRSQQDADSLFPGNSSSPLVIETSPVQEASPQAASLMDKDEPLWNDPSVRAIESEILVVGAGPAGMAAAVSASQAGKQVILIDDNPGPGGQIWRGADRHPISSEARRWLARVHSRDIRIIQGARVIRQPQPGMVVAELEDTACQIKFQKLIIATGARERFLPFPGWTLPGVMGAGGLQALIKSGAPIQGAKVVISGTGPLLLAVGAYIKRRGARVRLIAEQAPFSALQAFWLWLARNHPGKAARALTLRPMAGWRYMAGAWVVKAIGNRRLSSVVVQRGNEQWEEPCDYLACGFHLVPNVELAILLACDLNHGFVVIDEFQETSVPGIYCAGEPTGIGGLELSLIEGQIAGLAAAGAHAGARKLFNARRKHALFVPVMDRTFALRNELRSLADRQTLVCRCEDVALGQLEQYDSWRLAKLQTRCGMGPCQGRICGPAAEFLLGWKQESVRPPIMPARVSSLALECDRPGSTSCEPSP
jgi:NADPH-dependent 2,4-dienoyl-CoA reductase/sulfur reductase-like enzyme